MRTTHAFYPTSFDHLEKREVLSHVVIPAAQVAMPAVATLTAPHVAAPSPESVPHAAASTVVTLPNLGQWLSDIYRTSQNGASAEKLAASFPIVAFQGSMVGISIRARSSATTLAAELRTLGASSIATSTAYATVEAYVPVSQLAAVSNLDQTLAGSPLYKPVFFGLGGNGGLAR